MIDHHNTDQRINQTSCLTQGLLQLPLWHSLLQHAVLNTKLQGFFNKTTIGLRYLSAKTVCPGP